VVVFVALSPLPLAGDAAVVWGWSAVLVGLVAFAYWLWLAVTGASPAIPLRRVGVILPLFVVLVSYVAVQAMPLGAVAPIVAPSGEVFAPAAISVAPGTTALMLLQWLGYGMLFLLALQAAARQDRAQPILEWTFYAIVAHAALAMVLFTQMGDTIFGIEKWKFQGSVTGTFANRNNFATFLAFGLVTGIALVANSALERKRLFSIRTLLQTVGVVLIGIAIVGTNSRMGLAAAGFGTAVVIASAAAKARLSVRMSLVVAVLSLLVGLWGVLALGAGVVERIFELEGATADRSEVYSQVGAMIASRPLIGYGAGAFSAGFQLFHHPPLTIDAIYERAHSTYLALWAELGVIAGTIPLLIIAIVAFRTVSAFIAAPSQWTQSLAVIGVITVAAIHSTVDFSLEIQANAYLFALFLALGFTQPVRVEQGPG
jgi:O-antigen ligase